MSANEPVVVEVVHLMGGGRCDRCGASALMAWRAILSDKSDRRLCSICLPAKGKRVEPRFER